MSSNLTGKIATMAVAVSFAVAPVALTAGSYGSSAVKDDRVGRQASAGKDVWCGRLDRNIPAELAAQMACNGSARSAVATNRVNRFFRIPLPTNRRIPTDDDNPAPRTVVTTSEKPTPTPETPTASTSVGKWDRLGQLNVTPQNFDQQSQSFRNQVRGYYDTADGPNGNWSGFNPTP